MTLLKAVKLARTLASIAVFGRRHHELSAARPFDGLCPIARRSASGVNDDDDGGGAA